MGNVIWNGFSNLESNDVRNSFSAKLSITKQQGVLVRDYPEEGGGDFLYVVILISSR